MQGTRSARFRQRKLVRADGTLSPQQIGTVGFTGPEHLQMTASEIQRFQLLQASPHKSQTFYEAGQARPEPEGCRFREATLLLLLLVQFRRSVAD